MSKLLSRIFRKKGSAAFARHAADANLTAQAKHPARHFIYISNTKLDVLLPQIQKATGSRDEASVSLKLDLKVLSSEVRFGAKPPDVHRTKLITSLTEYIHQNTFCGAVTDDGEYIHDILNVRLMRHAKPDDFSTYCPLAEGQICFGGRCTGGAFAFLGSQHHIIGAVRGEGVLFPGTLPIYSDDFNSQIFDACYEEGTGDTMKVEILAVRHETHHFEYDGPTRFVIGSPIFVALA